MYSMEKPSRALLSLEESDKKEKAEGEKDYGTRTRTIPVVGVMPAMFGMTMATYCLAFLGKEQLK